MLYKVFYRVLVKKFNLYCPNCRVNITCCIAAKNYRSTPFVIHILKYMYSKFKALIGSASVVTTFSMSLNASFFKNDLTRSFFVENICLFDIQPTSLRISPNCLKCVY